MEIFAKPDVQGPTFRLALNRTHPQKLLKLQKLLVDAGTTRKCSISMVKFHAFNVHAPYSDEGITIPTNIEGIARMALTIPGKDPIGFFVRSTFPDIRNFMSNVDYYFSNQQFRKSFYLEGVNTLKSYVVIDITIAT